MWNVEGADVRVSLLCFARDDQPEKHLDGAIVPKIHSDLSARRIDITIARTIIENKGICFQGYTKLGPFDIPNKIARQWLQEPLNPNSRPNSDVIKPWINAIDVVRRPSDTWVIDFGTSMSDKDASFYVNPFAYVVSHVKPTRAFLRRDGYRKYWQLSL